MPTVTPLSLAWSLGAPTAGTPDEPRYLLGGLALPTTAVATGASLLALSDAWLAAALPYYQHCLNRALARQIHAAMAGQIPTGMATAACVETSPLDVTAHMAPRALRLPHLAIYPVSTAFAERTTTREGAVRTYRLDYLLPPLTHDQMVRVAPVLQAAEAVILLSTRYGASPSYLGGAAVWDACGCESVRVVSGQFGSLDRSDLALGAAMPALALTLAVALHQRHDADGGLPFHGANLTALATDETGDGVTVAVAHTEIP